MTLDLDKLCTDLAEFTKIMGRLGIPCKIRFEVHGVPIEVREVPGPVQVREDLQPVTPEKKAATVPSMARTMPGIRRKGGRIMKCPYCERLMDTRSLQSHAKDSHKGIYDSDVVRRYIKGESGITPVLIKALEISPGPAPGPAAEIVPGMHVRLVKPMDKGISNGMIGVVRKRVGKDFEVNFGKSGFRMMPPDSLEAV